MSVPPEIFAWLDPIISRDDPQRGGWSTDSEMKNVRFIRADLCADPALLAEAVEVLRYLLDDIQDYQRINNLGGENNHSQVRARAFLAKMENRHDR